MPPALVLGFVLASLYGLVFFALFGKGWLRFGLYWLVAVVGFLLGHWFADLVGLHVFSIGEANIVEGTVTSWLSLFAVHSWRR